MRAAIYARVSTEHQEKHGYSLPSQLEACRKYAKERGWQVVTEETDDVSGATIDRPGWERVLDMAEAGQIDVVVVYDLDRLARTVATQMIAEKQLKRLGVEIAYVQGDYPDTPEGKLNKTIRAAVAEFERELIRERMRRGRRSSVKSGNILVHGQPPYGYRLEERDGKRVLVIYEPEARVVRLIFVWYVYGDEDSGPLPMYTIARRLTEMGVPTYQDNHPETGGHKLRGRGEWSKSVIRQILVNETYAGIWRYGKRTRDNNGKWRTNPREHWIAVEVPAIVDRELWEKAQERLKLNKERARRNRKHQYLLSGRVRCGLCGSKMAGRGVKDSYGLYLYYRCPATYHKDYACTCDLPGFRANGEYGVDTVVWNYIHDLLVDPGSLHAFLKVQQTKQAEASRPLRDRLAIVEDLLADHRAKLERLLDLYLAGDFPKEMLTERKARLETTIQALERERADLRAQLEASTLTDEQIRTIDDLARRMLPGLKAARDNFEAQRRIIDLLDVQVTLTVEEGEKVAYLRVLLLDEIRCELRPIPQFLYFVQDTRGEGASQKCR